MNISVDIFKLCRLCQGNIGIWGVTEDNLIEKILRCTQIELQGEEIQFFKICSECKETISVFYKYLQVIYKADVELKQKIKQYESLFSRNDILKYQQQERSTLYKLQEDSQHSTACEDLSTNLEKPNSNEGSTPFDNENKNCNNCDDACTCKPGANLQTNYTCDWNNCGKICSSAYTLRTHQMRHENKKPFLCITCGNHEAYIVWNKVKSNILGKRFITKNSLNCHEKIHLVVKAYSCQLCNISFSVKSNLRAHEKKHHEGFKFYCTKCTKAYGSKASLERHERVHTGIKEYHCTSCSSAFYTNKELIKHQVYHQGLRQHKCNECFKTFFEKHHLKVHLRIHTGERPYICTVSNCEKAFTESQKLTRHLKTKHAHG